MYATKGRRLHFPRFYASLWCLAATYCSFGETSPDWSRRLDGGGDWPVSHDSRWWPGRDSHDRRWWPGRDSHDRRWWPGSDSHDRRWADGPGPCRPERSHNPYHPRRPLQTAIKLLHLDEGDVCRRGHRLYPDYVCAKASDCSGPLTESVNADNYLDLCTFDGAQVIVCCPASSSTIDEPPTTVQIDVTDNRSRRSNVADEKCRLYSNLRFPKENFWFIAVVGGREALSQEFPHMAVLGYGDTTDLEEDWKCGGSLISEKWILTAAHCRTDKSGNLAQWARLGELNIGSSADSSVHKDYKIVEHVLHPDYNSSERYNDIGLFRLEKDVEFSSYSRPICLNTDPSLNPKVQIATGWGRTSTAESTSDVLLKVALNVFPASRCNETYFTEGSTELRFGVRADSMICAGSYKDDQDTCSGDSGGPLQVENAANPGTYTQFGITSFGPAFCGVKETPGVYTKVSRYVPWIERIVWPDENLGGRPTDGAVRSERARWSSSGRDEHLSFPTHKTSNII